ncbi:hydrogen gas-evolving membrane-bound hydrogenase subunit E [Lentisalinibacter sediminis]|uniref:hydrogen gas-evolving membrane-bound hydrogenase subunit E n=1 Tax=Lentisalinibacter sediminis TaxID=2992237 RepID=UPI00386903ED
MRRDRWQRRLLRAVLGLALLAVAAGVSLALMTPPVAPGLGDAIRGALPGAAAANPVTAVLLDFRGYDTLLEMAVLTAALAGVWSLGRAHRTRPTNPSPVLIGLTRVIAPLFPMICGYLLWVGADGPGGAFQAGAVLATAAVLYVLSERRPGPRLPEQPMRAGAVAGLGVFLAVALGVMAGGGRFLEYPAPLGGALLLLIETAAAVAIALILAGLFIGGRPGGSDG